MTTTLLLDIITGKRGTYMYAWGLLCKPNEKDDYTFVNNMK